MLANNDLPRASNDIFTVSVDQTGLLDVLSNDAGLGDGGLMVVVTSPPMHGTATADRYEIIHYEPGSGS